MERNWTKAWKDEGEMLGRAADRAQMLDLTSIAAFYHSSSMKWFWL